jgi:uncharacterized protein (DUF1501 family)
MDRRLFLRGLSALGCSAAAHPFLTTVTLAGSDGGAPLGDRRLIVVILRGAMDGLDVVRPVDDPDYAALRPSLLGGGAPLPLSGIFALHPALTDLHALWQAGEAGFVHAVSTPYRDKRSHFDGQDLLEAGTGMDVGPDARRDGWLNRLLQAVPGVAAETAFAVGREALPLLAGPAPSLSWTPELKLGLSAQSRLLLEHIWHDDPLFRDSGLAALHLAAGTDAAALAEGRMAAGAERGMAEVDGLVDFAAGKLRAATRIAAFSLSGWDTHRGQEAAIRGPLLRLERIVLRMKEMLGPEVWGRTALLAMTEFGRTVRENGSRGTDHGTGGVMLTAGGALRGGQVFGRWPGLAEDALYDRRDLMPTSDVRAWAAWVMAGLYGLDRGVLERAVFPGLEMGGDPGLVR